MATRSFRARRAIFGSLILSFIHLWGEGSAVTLSWDPNPETNIANYRLFYGETNISPTVKNVGNTTTTQVTNLIAGRTYAFYVTAINTAGLESDPSNTIVYTEPQQAQPPAAPSALTATAASPTQVQLHWTDNSANETGFRLLRKTGANGTYTTNSLGANVTSFADSNLSASTQYFYKIQAFNATGSSAFSTEISVTTPAPQPQPPAAPSSLAGTADSANQIRLQWVDNSANETGFLLLRKAGPSGTFVTNSLGANVTSFTDSGLTASTQYFYKVQAFNGAGSSAFSSEISITTPADPPPLNGGVQFLSADTITGGSWKGNYGRDGYAVMADSQINPGYTSVTPSGQSQWIWNWTTDDTSALERASNSSRLAACWYAADTFQANIPLSGTGPYRLSVYCLDWDLLNRSEQLDIIDPSSGQILDRQTLSDFFDGIYLTWEITKPVILKVTRIAGPNAVISGIFFDSTAAVAPPVFTPASGSFSNSVTLTMRTATAGATIHYTLDGSIPTASSPTFSGSLVLTNTTTVSARAFKSGLTDSTVTMATYTRASASSSRVRFIGADVTRGGTWKGSLGLEGQTIANETPGLPSYASVSLAGAETWIWSFPASSLAALERPYQSGRIATTWYGSTFAANISVKDSAPHRVSLYFVDYDKGSREETVDIIDPITNAVLDSVYLSNFGSGIWLQYEITGSLGVRVTSQTGANGVMSGIFFDKP